MRIMMLPLILALPGLLGGVPNPPQPSISDLHIYLFCDATGEWTSDITEMDGIEDWDLATGEGGAPCISTATMLVFAVKGAPNTTLHPYELKVSAREQLEEGSVFKNEVATHSLPLGVTNSEGEVFVPVLLNRAACKGIWVGAQVGSAPPAMVFPLRSSCNR